MADGTLASYPRLSCLRGIERTFHGAKRESLRVLKYCDRYFLDSFGDDARTHLINILCSQFCETEYAQGVSADLHGRPLGTDRGTVAGGGDFVFIAAKGTHEGEPCVYIDLYRVKDEKIVEHWGFPEMVSPKEQWKNNNGML